MRTQRHGRHIVRRNAGFVSDTQEIGGRVNSSADFVFLGEQWQCSERMLNGLC